MKKIIELLESTIIFWLPILTMAIAQKLTEIINPEVFMKALWVTGGIIALLLLKGDIKKCLEERK